MTSFTNISSSTTNLTSFTSFPATFFGHDNSSVIDNLTTANFDGTVSRLLATEGATVGPSTLAIASSTSGPAGSSLTPDTFGISNHK
jgi:hypothetical protein